MTAPEMPYEPPPQLLEQAIAGLAGASREELGRAEDLFTAYGRATGGLSAVTGKRLPLFDECPPLVRWAWVCAVRGNAERPRMPDHIRTNGAG